MSKEFVDARDLAWKLFQQTLQQKYYIGFLKNNYIAKDKTFQFCIVVASVVSILSINPASQNIWLQILFQSIAILAAFLTLAYPIIFDYYSVIRKLDLIEYECEKILNDIQNIIVVNELDDKPYETGEIAKLLKIHSELNSKFNYKSKKDKIDSKFQSQANTESEKYIENYLFRINSLEGKNCENEK